MDSTEKTLPLAIVGRPGAGRSAVLLALVNNLAGKGYRVGVVKHLESEDAESGRSGKDTYLYQAQGAQKIILSGQKHLTVFADIQRECSVRELLREFPGYDFVFFESYFINEIPALEVHQQAAGDLISKDWPNVIAICSDSRMPAPDGLASPKVRFFAWNQLADLADFLEQYSSAHRPAHA